MFFLYNLNDCIPCFFKPFFQEIDDILCLLCYFRFKCHGCLYWLSLDIYCGKWLFVSSRVHPVNVYWFTDDNTWHYRDIRRFSLIWVSTDVVWYISYSASNNDRKDYLLKQTWTIGIVPCTCELRCVIIIFLRISNEILWFDNLWQPGLNVEVLWRWYCIGC